MVIATFIVVDKKCQVSPPLDEILLFPPRRVADEDHCHFLSALAEHFGTVRTAVMKFFDKHRMHQNPATQAMETNASTTKTHEQCSLLQPGPVECGSDMSIDSQLFPRSDFGSTISLHQSLESTAMYMKYCQNASASLKEEAGIHHFEFSKAHRQMKKLSNAMDESLASEKSNESFKTFLQSYNECSNALSQAHEELLSLSLARQSLYDEQACAVEECISAISDFVARLQKSDKHTQTPGGMSVIAVDSTSSEEETVGSNVIDWDNDPLKAEGQNALPTRNTPESFPSQSTTFFADSTQERGIVDDGSESVQALFDEIGVHVFSNDLSSVDNETTVAISPLPYKNSNVMAAHQVDRKGRHEGSLMEGERNKEDGTAQLCVSGDKSCGTDAESSDSFSSIGTFERPEEFLSDSEDDNSWVAEKASVEMDDDSTSQLLPLRLSKVMIGDTSTTDPWEVLEK